MRDAERIRYLVLALQRDGNRDLIAALRPLGLTPAQSEVLRILGDHAPLSLMELGGMLVCESGTNPSRLVDKLVRAGLVDRAPDPGDRRLVELRLTAAGRSAERDVRAVEDAMYDGIDAALQGVDVAQLTGLLAGLVAGRPSGDALQRRDTSAR